MLYSLRQDLREPPSTIGAEDLCRGNVISDSGSSTHTNNFSMPADFKLKIYIRSRSIKKQVMRHATGKEETRRALRVASTGELSKRLRLSGTVSSQNGQKNRCFGNCFPNARQLKTIVIVPDSFSRIIARFEFFRSFLEEKILCKSCRA